MASLYYDLGINYWKQSQLVDAQQDKNQKLYLEVCAFFLYLFFFGILDFTVLVVVANLFQVIGRGLSKLDQCHHAEDSRPPRRSQGISEHH